MRFLIFAVALAAYVPALAGDVTVKIQGPTQVDSGGFALVGECDKPDAVLRWRVDAPDGAAPPLELLDSQGRPVLVFMSPAPGSYKAVLTAQVPADGLDPFGEGVHRTKVGKGPRPTPEPDIDPVDPVDPDPPPTPDDNAPFPSDGLAVLIVYETGDASRLSSGHRAIIFGADARKFLDETTKTEADGRTPAYRIFDKDVDISVIDNRWKAAMGVARESLPWVVVSNGRTGFSGPLPATVDEFKALVGKFK